MSIGHQFSSSLRWVATGRLASQVISWVGTIFVMRTLAPQDYGLAAICTTILSIVTLVSEFGIGAAIVQAVDLSQQQLRAVFGASVLFSLSAAAAVIFSAPLLAWFFRAPQAAPLIQVSAAQLILAPLTCMPDAYLRREMQFRGTSIIDFFVAVSTSLTTVGLAWRGSGVWALILGPVLGAAVRAVLLNIMVPQRLWPSFNLRPARDVIAFGFKVALARVTSYAFGQSDVLIAGRMLSKAALGEYSVAMYLAMMPVSKVMNVVNQVTYPTIARMNREQMPIRPLLLGNLRLFGYAVVPVLWGLAAVAPWLIPAAIGPHWEAAILPLQIVCLILPLRLLTALLNSVIQGMGHAGVAMWNTVIGVIVLPICFLAGVHFGSTGLALAWVIGLPIVTVLNLRNSFRVMHVGIFETLRALAKPVLLSALMVGGVTLVGHWAATAMAIWPALFLMIGTGVLIYVTALWSFDRPSLTQLMSLTRPQAA